MTYLKSLFQPITQGASSHTGANLVWVALFRHMMNHAQDKNLPNSIQLVVTPWKAALVGL